MHAAAVQYCFELSKELVSFMISMDPLRMPLDPTLTTFDLDLATETYRASINQSIYLSPSGMNRKLRRCGVEWGGMDPEQTRVERGFAWLYT